MKNSTTLPIRAVIFDCDGTLVSSQLGIFKGIKSLMQEYLGREVSSEEVQQKYTPDMQLLAQRFGLDLSKPEILAWAKRRWGELMNQGHSEYQAFEGVAKLLEQLSSMDLELYVWTARDRKSTRELLIRLDLMKYFLDMRCFDDCAPKPNPLGLRELTPHIENKKEIIVIGDSSTDIQGAKSFGAYAFAALWDPFVNKDDLVAAKADVLVETPAKFLDKMASI